MGPPPFGDGKSPLSAPDFRPLLRFNGATAFRRWKAGRLPLPQAAVAGLQWGHRLSAMERTPWRRYPWPTRWASMGPPPFGDGKVGGTWHNPWEITRASMGPPPFGDGKIPTKARRLSKIRASMGPPPFGDGKQLVGQPAMGSGNASMGPPPFGDGKSKDGVQGAVDSRGFNGATAFRRWKGSPTWSTYFRLTALQWGHRLSAMESGEVAQEIEQQIEASMGPPPFGDGKSDGFRRSTAPG